MSEQYKLDILETQRKQQESEIQGAQQHLKQAQQRCQHAQQRLQQIKQQKTDLLKHMAQQACEIRNADDVLSTCGQKSIFDTFIALIKASPIVIGEAEQHVWSPQKEHVLWIAKPTSDRQEKVDKYRLVMSLSPVSEGEWEPHINAYVQRANGTLVTSEQSFMPLSLIWGDEAHVIIRTANRFCKKYYDILQTL
jgi:hypothetical protein